MTNYLRSALTALLLIGAPWAQAGWLSASAEIDYIQAGQNGLLVHILTSENPNNCTYSHWFILDTSKPFYREILATAYQAHALRHPVRVLVTDECSTGGYYSVIHSLRMDPRPTP